MVTIGKLQQLLRGWFGFVAMAYALSAVTLTPALFLSPLPHTTTMFYQEGMGLRILAVLLVIAQRLIFAIPLLLTGVFGVTWWKLKFAKSGARRWGLAASIVMLLSVVPLLPAIWMWHEGYTNGITVICMFLIVGSLSSGVAGIFAFSRKGSQSAIEAGAQPPRVDGDGTHKLLDVLGLAMQLGGTLTLISFYTRWGYDHDLPNSHGLEAWIQWIVVIAAVTLIHESAHALFGVALGMKLRAFIIGPFQWRVIEGRWTFSFRPTQILAFSGAAGLTSVDPDQSRWNEVVMIAAGPFANVVTGTVAAALAYSAEDHSWWSYWEYFALFATVSLVAGIVNLIPLQPSGLYSDGARIVQLFRHSPAADFSRVVRCVSSTLVSPRRPRDYDLAAIERASAYFNAGQEALLLRVWKCSCCLDRGELASASEALTEAERIYHESAADISPDLHTGFIIKGITLGRDRPYILEWWNSMEAKKPKNFDQDYWLAKSVFHWPENNISAAREAWNTGHAYCEKLPDFGTYNYDRDRYAYIKGILVDEGIYSKTALADPGLQPSPA